MKRGRKNTWGKQYYYSENIKFKSEIPSQQALIDCVILIFQYFLSFQVNKRTRTVVKMHEIPEFYCLKLQRTVQGAQEKEM